MSSIHGFCSLSWGQVNKPDASCGEKVVQNHWVNVAASIIVIAAIILSLLSTFGILNLGVGAYVLYGIAGLTALMLLGKNLVRCRMMVNLSGSLSSRVHGKQGLTPERITELKEKAGDYGNERSTITGFNQTHWKFSIDALLDNKNFKTNPAGHWKDFVSEYKRRSHFRTGIDYTPHLLGFLQENLPEYFS